MKKLILITCSLGVLNTFAQTTPATNATETTKRKSISEILAEESPEVETVNQIDLNLKLKKIDLSKEATRSITTKEKIISGSGTNIGGGNNSSEYLATWCRGQQSLLRNYRDRAQLKLNNSGNYNISNKILTDGIVQALSSLNGQQSTFLSKSLQRGLVISRQLNAATATDERKAMSTYYVLSNYYNFMIETVARDLDLNGFIPFESHGGERNSMNPAMMTFEQNFVIFANTQLTWVLANMMGQTKIGSRLLTTPVGDAKSVIKISLTLTEATAEDLDESLWNHKFSCAISDLKNLSFELNQYDQGNRDMFESDAQALEYINKELTRIAKSIDLKGGCR